MTCPICGGETLRRYRPFCSRRCADVDLGRWLTGGYAIPSDEAEGEDGDDRPDMHPPIRPH
ncbi:DNA gyrase inhibitor YacG [Rhodobacteraceae bacterium CCMM004]|nr:DNA gyrase inhibitor YacG [Rhodobacteraceae bacterium CCMM004]